MLVDLHLPVATEAVESLQTMIGRDCHWCPCMQRPATVARKPHGCTDGPRPYARCPGPNSQLLLLAQIKPKPHGYRAKLGSSSSISVGKLVRVSKQGAGMFGTLGPA